MGLSRKEKTGLLIAGSLGGLVVFGLMAMVVIMCLAGGSGGASSSRPGTGGSTKRLVLENHASDDGARTFIFQKTLRGGGIRCDSITDVSMVRRGIWVVTCSPASAYRFEFDEAGKLVANSRVL